MRTNVDEGPSKRNQVKGIDDTQIELILKQSKIETWCTRPLMDYAEDDRLLKRRKMTLEEKKLSPRFSVPNTLQGEEVRELLKDMIRAARIIHLDWVELYFAEEDAEWGPFSIRNELEALHSILSSINSISTLYDTKEALAVLREAVISLMEDCGKHQHENMNRILGESPSVLAAKELLASGKTSGMVTKLDVACFHEAGRGLVASEDIKIDDVALEVPMDLVICGDLMESDLDVCFEEFKLSPEDKRLLWIMKEMNSPRKRYRRFFELMSQGLNSGVLFGGDAEGMMRLTPLQTELSAAKGYLEYQFRKAIEPIMKKHGAMFNMAAFKSAWVLWNSCSVSIVDADEKLCACLVPVAGFFNHSQCPHVLYGKHVSSTKVIQFIASRPCNKGEQCYLSYGNLSGAEFITFYGFVPKDVNYHDVVSFAFGDDFRDTYTFPLQDKMHWSYQKARGKWFYSGKSGLTAGLVKHVKAVTEDEDGFLLSDKDVYWMLLERFRVRGIGWQVASLDPDDFSSPEMKVVHDYTLQYGEVLGDLISECHEQFERLN